jgi:hypothetical protein
MSAKSKTGIDRLAMETSADTLADLENLALRHEIRREAIFRELERRRKKNATRNCIKPRPEELA